MGNKVQNEQKLRRIAIGDIHGYYENLIELLEKKIKITKEDEVYLLGDVVSKGSRIRETLEYVITQINKGL